VKAKWEVEWCIKPYSCRLKGNAGGNRSVPMKSEKPQAARIYKLKSGYAPTGAYLGRFGHRADNICWWCREGASHMREHLFHHCSQLKDD